MARPRSGGTCPPCPWRANHECIRAYHGLVMGMGEHVSPLLEPCMRDICPKLDAHARAGSFFRICGTPTYKFGDEATDVTRWRINRIERGRQRLKTSPRGDVLRAQVSTRSQGLRRCNPDLGATRLPQAQPVHPESPPLDRHSTPMQVPVAIHALLRSSRSTRTMRWPRKSAASAA